MGCASADVRAATPTADSSRPAYPPRPQSQRRFGWVYEPREGMRELLKALLDPSAGVYLTLWSENSTGVAGEILDKLMQALSAPAAHTPPVSLQRTRTATAFAKRVVRLPLRPLRALPLAAQLGIEHMFIRENGKRKEKRLEYFARDPRTVLLIDHDALSEALNPNNTVLVQPMAPKAEGGAAPAPDATCAAIRALIGRIREDVQASGSVNVPRALARMRADAKHDGFPTDATGLYAFLGKQVAAEEALEREKRETGLGGVMRRMAASSTAVRARATTVEAAARRPFRDPAWDTGDDSLLAQKVRETVARALGPGPG